MPRLISVSELIDRSWEQYRAAFADCLSITAWLLVPGLLLVIALLFYPTADTLLLGSNFSRLQNTGVILYLITHSLLLPLVALWAYAALVRLGNAISLRGKGEPRKHMREAWNLFPFVLGATVLYSLIVILGYVGPLIPGFGLSILTTGRYDATWMVFLRNALVVIGVFTSAVLAVRWFGLFQFGPVAVASGDVPARGSLGMSAKLVRGRFWNVMFRAIVPKVLFFMLGTIALWIASSLINIGVSLSAIHAPFVALRIGTLAFSLISWIGIPIFLTPLLAFVDVNLYRSLKETV